MAGRHSGNSAFLRQPSAMRLSVIIAAHNEGLALAKTLGSVVETCSGLDHEIVLADDASEDGSVEATTREFPRVRVISHPERQGASPTKALGAQNARGDVLVFLDGHTKPERGTISRLVEDVESLRGQAIVTPKIPALDVEHWRNCTRQIGHGYRVELETLDCGWLSLNRLRHVIERQRPFYESPALIGCALAVSRELYDKLWGFDPHMRMWGVEDLDFGLKCWLLGHRILHDPEAVVGHRFRRSFDNYAVPLEHILVNQLWMARKNFTAAVWSQWVEHCRERHAGGLSDHPEGLWALVWELFQADRASVEQERSYLHAHRIRDEFWYAERFGLSWPRLESAGVGPGLSAQSIMEAEPSPSPSPPPPPCNATLRFLDNNNTEISPATKALNVSNHVTNIELPGTSGFDDTAEDPDNFRLEVEDADAPGASVSVSLKVGERSAITFTLDKKSGNKFRGEFLRLVTDSVDDQVQGNQTIICKLGETVVLTYRRKDSDCEDKHQIDIGRPVSEDDNGADELKHDIRELNANVVVFSKPGTTKLDGAIDDAQTTIKVESVATAHTSGVIKIEGEVIAYTGVSSTTREFINCTRGAEGTAAVAHADDTDVLYSTTTPSISKSAVDADLDIVDERLAQSTIRLKRPVDIDIGGEGDPGKKLPSAMLDGFSRSDNPKRMETLTDDEKAIVAFKDSEADSIDVFYVDRVFTDDTPPASIRGHAFINKFNETGDAKYQNFVLISATKGPFTTPHEFLHVLLDSEHRADDPETALFKSPTSSSNAVGGTKRVGPYKDDGSGDMDTRTIRATAENLP